MMAIRPETITSTISVQPVGPMAGLPGAGFSSAWNMLNLATKPDSGGRPAIIKAHAANAKDRKAMAAGTPAPRGSSGASSTAHASIVTASNAKIAEQS